MTLHTHDDLPDHAEFYGWFATMRDFGEYLVEELRGYSDDVEHDFLEDFLYATDESRSGECADSIDYEAYAYACTVEQNGAFMLVADKVGLLAYNVG